MQKKTEIRVLLVDSHQIVRKGICQEIEKQLDMVVVGETGNGYQALELVKQLAVDVIILDVHLSGLDGVKLAHTLNELASNTAQPSLTPAILIFTSYNDKQYVWSFLATGARGYLLKNEPLDCLLTGIRQVMAGQTVLSQTIQTNLVELIPSLNQELSKGELKVIQLLARGLTNQEIAQFLHISENTVKSHLNNTYRKIPWIRNRAEAISWAWINRVVSESQ